MLWRPSVCERSSVAPQLRRISLGRPGVNQALALVGVVLVASLGLQAPVQNSLTRRRCSSPSTGDSTGVIRVKLDPPEAGRGSFSIVLFEVRSTGGDSLVSDPAFGTDTFRITRSGLYRLWVRQIGYRAVRDTLRVRRGEAWCPTVHLVRDAMILKSSP